CRSYVVFLSYCALVRCSKIPILCMRTHGAATGGAATGPCATAHRSEIVLSRLPCLAHPRYGRGSGNGDLCVNEDFRTSAARQRIRDDIGLCTNNPVTLTVSKCFEQSQL